MREAIRRHWWWVPVAALAFFFALNIARTATAPSPALARPADAEKARRAVAPPAGEDRRWPRDAGTRLVVGNGVVEPRGQVIRVAGAAAGRIAQIAVAEGDRVPAGALLARLDDATERAELAAAEAELAAATAERDRVRRGNRREDRRAAVARAEQAASRAGLSQSVYERTLRLHEQATGVVALAELDRVRRAAEADRQAALQAQAERDRVLAGARSESRRAATARLAGARARVERARAQLAQRSIRAPGAGEVLRVSYRAGEYYLPGQGEPLLALGDTRRLRVRMEVDERDLARVARGARAFVEAPAYPGRRFAASVADVGRRMGRKAIATDDPDERQDVDVLEVQLELAGAPPLVVGQRVIAYVSPPGKTAPR